jgi:hypothetical protein
MKPPFGTLVLMKGAGVMEWQDSVKVFEQRQEIVSQSWIKVGSLRGI